MTIIPQLTKLLFQAAKELGLEVDKDQIVLEHPADPKHGDYSSNLALLAFGQQQQNSQQNSQKNNQKNGQTSDQQNVRPNDQANDQSNSKLNNQPNDRKNNRQSTPAYRSPRDLADKITALINSTLQDNDYLHQVEVAGPGFINFWLSDKWLLEQMTDLQTKGADHKNGQKVMVEFTDPNPFKEFHIGHLYSNSVGESIARLLEWRGYEVKRACYQGDVGMHVAKSIFGLKQKLQDDDLSLDKISKWSLSERVHYLGQAYSLGATAYKENLTAQQQIKEINFLVYKAGQDYLVEKNDWTPQVDYDQFVAQTDLVYADIKELYQSGKQWSLDYFESIYKQLGTKFDEYFYESLVGEYGLKVVREFLNKGVFTESDGAVIFPGEKLGLHNRVFINSLGLPTYEAKELGLAPEKYRRFKYDRSIIITGNEIDEYFKVLLRALSLTYPELAAKTTHISHGMVRLPDGKMSSRTGKILTGEWLISEAQRRVEEIATGGLEGELKSDSVVSRHKFGLDYSQEKLNDMSLKVGIAAIKFALLKAHVGGDIAFSFEESLSFSGNSGPYVMYTYTRCRSVLEKNDQEIVPQTTFAGQLESSEAELLRLLYQFDEIIEKSVQELSPHHLARYLFELSQAFSSFYTNCPILSAEDSQVRQLRLGLTRAVSNLLKHGLELLGIETVEKM